MGSLLVIGTKPGHDGGFAVIEDGRLVMSIECEKDSYPRHASLTPSALLQAAGVVDRVPDVFAIGGWHQRTPHGVRRIGAGYYGSSPGAGRPARLWGREVRVHDVSHERSHVMMAVGMAPPQAESQAVLVWEGDLGHFYELDASGAVTSRWPVMSEPGARYSLLYGIIDPTFPDFGAFPRLSDAGKLMALAAYGNSDDADDAIGRSVDDICTTRTCYPAPKHLFRGAPFYNVGVESAVAHTAAALLSSRICGAFEQRAIEVFRPGMRLCVSGGCGLNCNWNARLRHLGLFSSVFVPPCADDSGAALGAAIDAFHSLTGQMSVNWHVYSGLEFVCDIASADGWNVSDYDVRAIAQWVADGDVIPWVQGRSEIGPRALGNRSLLASPFNISTRDRLNDIKRRESFRPIAPCVRQEDLHRVSDDVFSDPCMLFIRRIVNIDLKAITHVDGSARCQTVTSHSNRKLHDLLSVFSGQVGIGVMCNTSLNWPGRGFINRLSDLLAFCDVNNLYRCVVNDRVYERAR
jgi:hydroxymethyl cephem carbamoyltransferase